MTPTEFEILHALDRDGPLTATELTANRGRRRSWQSYDATLRALQERSLVRRQSDSPIWELTVLGTFVAGV